jgi:hypothetical protein
MLEGEKSMQNEPILLVSRHGEINIPMIMLPEWQRKLIECLVRSREVECFEFSDGTGPVFRAASALKGSGARCY